MFKKIFITVSMILVTMLYLSAQNHVEALRYSQQFYSVTAKSEAMGNAISAVGADMSALSINPAGIAVYKNTQFTFTPNFILSNTEGTFSGSSRNESRFGFNISNIGFAGSVPLDGIIKNVSFGLAWNSTNDFRQRTIVSANDQAGSILDFIVYNENNGRTSEFREDLAWSAWLFDVDDTGEAWSFVTDDGTYGINQRKEVRTKGGMGEFDFTTGINISNMLYLGGTLALTSINYKEINVLNETSFPEIYRPAGDPPVDILVNPDEINFEQVLYTNGTGFNAKFGLLFQPLSFLRLGGAIHSPTYFEITEDYNSEMYVNYPVPDEDGNFSYNPRSENNIFDYRVSTPFRANAGLALILDAYPIGNFFTVPMTFSVDYEYVDYSSARIYESYYDSYIAEFDDANDDISVLYKEAHNFRAGAEINFGVIKFRGGYALYSSPYAADTDIFENAKVVYSGGFGFASKHSFIDFSYSYSPVTSTLWIYNANDIYPNDPIGNITEPSADIKNIKQFFKVTMGFRF